MRGLAALSVVFCHIIQLGFISIRLSFTGELGVSIFFSLSGFLMAFLYAREPLTFRTATDYAISRFSRIAPAYLLVVIACWLITRYVDPDFIFAITDHNILRHLLFSGSVGVFWSIPPEIQFYIFFFAIWFAVGKACTKAYLPAIAVLLICIAMHACSKNMPGILLPTKLSFFFFGSVAGIICAYIRPCMLWPKIALFIQLFLLFAVACYACYIHDMSGSEAVYSTLPYSLLCGMLVFAFACPGKYSDAIFGAKPFALSGKLSFTIYLIHVPCLYAAHKLVMSGYLNNWLALILGLFAMFGFAAIMHRHIERPAQRYLKGLARKWKL